MKKIVKYIGALFTLILGIPFVLSAQTTTDVADQGMSQLDVIGLMLFLTAGILVVVTLALTILIIILVRRTQKGSAATEGEETEQRAEGTAFEEQSAWDRIRLGLTDAVPIEAEASIDMGHDYDGIRELDNNLPPWWKYGFYITIVAAFFYFFYYQIYSDWSSEGEYMEEMTIAAKELAAYKATQTNLVDETSAVVLEDEQSLANGQKLFMEKCIACHGAFGEGLSGPNLTDEYWIHGGGVNNIFKTVKYGVPAKGMLAWAKELKPRQIQEVASYIISLEGTNPANPKAPEGEIYTPTDSMTIDSVSTNPIAIN